MGIQRWDMIAVGENTDAMLRVDDGDYVLFTDHEQVVAELSRQLEDTAYAAVLLQDSVDRLRAELAAKSKELRRIQIRATPHPDDNDDDRKRNLYHIESIAKAALGEGNGR